MKDLFGGTVSVAPRLPFGRYRYVPLDEVPGDYLAWVRDCVNLTPNLQHCVEQELRRRGARTPKRLTGPGPCAASALADAEELLVERLEREGVENLATISDVVLEVFETIRKRHGVEGGLS